MFSASEFTHHYTKSVFKYTEPISGDYKVYVNGREIPVYTCRISAYPFNRVWPGFQRPVNQSELASFVNIVSDEELKIEVVVNKAYENIYLKPYSKGIVPEIVEERVCFTLKEHGQFVLEADDYHHCLYIFNSKPITCEDPTSVTHYFGPGIHMVGKIELHDNESVYVDKDALVFGWIFAENAGNLHIYGNGVLDDSGEARFSNACYEAYCNGNVKFYDCENLRMEGVLLRNSAIWCVNLFHCFDVKLDDIKVFGQWRYNTDGIDIVNCRDITVTNSFIHSFDDTITIKGIERYLETDNENMLFEKCVFWCDWNKTCEIGIETACREYKNITFRDCDILRGGDTALDIANGECAEVHHITFENIRVEYNSFDVPQLYQSTDEMVYESKGVVHVPHLIKISNNRFRTPGCWELWGVPLKIEREIDLSGIETCGVHDITIRNIRVYYDEAIPKKDGKWNVPVRIQSCVEGVEFYNIDISDVTLTPTRGGRIVGETVELDLGQ
ncbi:MAG: hypothetical protein E7286_09000 [Lachnospiraceae bacterium]|nr:hypothetical protein [Lachnospiraceae bacterium]